MSAAYQVGLLVEKMSSPDKDFRFMAINDLMKELVQGKLSLEEDSTAKVVRALIRLLGDTNGEVQNLAIKCIGTLAQPGRIRQRHLETIVDHVGPNIITKKDAERDVHSMTMKAVIQNLAPANPSNSSSCIVKRIISNIIEPFSKNDKNIDDGAKIDVIDILGDLLLRFGDTFPEYHNAIHGILCSQLSSPRQTIRKRSTAAFGYLASVASPALYDEVVSGLLDKLGNSKTPMDSRTFILALTYVSKSSGVKFSAHLPKVIPYLIQFLRSSNDDDLKEAALQGLEAFLYRCPAEVASFQTDVQNVLASNISYDPNYEYGDEDEEEDEMEYDEDEDDYSDDDDMTWKVRRASAKAIEAMIASRRESLLNYVQALGPLLISRFKEREETVRNEVLSAYIALLNQLILLIPNIQSAVLKVSSEDSMQTDDVITIGSTQFSTLYVSNEQAEILKALSEQKDKLLKSIEKVLKHHVKSGPKCLELLTALVKAYPGCLKEYMKDIIPGVSKIITEKSATAQGKMIALNFIAKALALHEAVAFEHLLEPLTDIVIVAIEDPFYKVSSEGLAISSKMADILCECPNGKSLIHKVFESVNKKFVSNDTDQDVRERSIVAMTHIVALFKEDFGSQIPNVMEKLTERQGREMTCLVATRCASEMVAADVKFTENQLKQILDNVCEYLKKMSRSLRIASLALIENLLIHKELNTIPNVEMSRALGELYQLINDNDLQITNKTLNCLSVAISDLPGDVEPHMTKILEASVRLVQSPLLQGAALVALMNLFSNIVKSDINEKPTFERLLDAVSAPVYDVPTLTRQAYTSISSCVSIITEATNDDEKSRTLAKKLATELANPNSNDSIKLFAMSALGELGRRLPHVFEQCDFEPAKLAVDSFNLSNEELKSAAALALGALAVGNLQKHLPFILEQIRVQPKKQYLLLHALKEVIVWESSEGRSNKLFTSAVDDIWTMLMNNAGGHEDGTRSVLSECLGRLCSFDPESLLPKLKEHVKSPDPVIRAVVVSAIKYMINDDKRAADVVLQKNFEDFLVTVKDSDLNVRRFALVVLNSAAHNKPSLIREILPGLLPAVYEETKMRKELIREVEIGPFKHQVDDGLDLRKCAFECMYTLLQTMVDKIDVREFLCVMEVGLKDPSNEVKLLNYLTLQKVALIAPGQLLQRLDKICEPLKQQLSIRPRHPNPVKPEIEKLEEIKKAAVRAILALKNCLPDIERQQQFFDLYNNVMHSKELQSITESVLNESQRIVNYDVTMESS